MSRNLLQGLVGAWCPSLGPSGYTLLDRSGRGNHGTLTNMDAGAWKGSAGGWALNCDGANDRVTTTYSSPFNFTTATSQFTIAMWAYRNTNATAAARFALWKGTGTSAAGGYGFDLGENDAGTDATKGSVIIYSGSGQWTGQNFAITDNVWFHVAMVVNMALTSTARVAAYVNGVATGTPFSQNPGSAILGNTNPITIGNATTNNLPFSGMLDDICVIGRAITAGEMWQLYQLGRGGLGRLLTQRAQRRVFRTAQGNRRRRLICGAEC
mgnify:CR=1 FL=1